MKLTKLDFDYYKMVELPHIRTTVYFADMSKLQGVPITGAGFCVETGMTFAEDGRTEICIFLQDIEVNVKNISFMPYLAHEIMHAIQIMCQNLQMKVDTEIEHSAYIMHYLLESIIEK